MFNDAWDDAFKDALGEEFNHDNEEHAKLYDRAWKEYKSEAYGFWGLVFEVNKDFLCEEAHPPLPGGFYHDLYDEFKRQHPNVVDLRLD